MLHWMESLAFLIQLFRTEKDKSGHVDGDNVYSVSWQTHFPHLASRLHLRFFGEGGDEEGDKGGAREEDCTKVRKWGLFVEEMPRLPMVLQL